MKHELNAGGASAARTHIPAVRMAQSEVRLENARAAVRQLRQLLEDPRLVDDQPLRLSLAEELLREIEGLGIELQRPTVRQTAARVRRALGLPSMESTAVSMPLDTALAFLSLAIDPPMDDHLRDQQAG